MFAFPCMIDTHALIVESLYEFIKYKMVVTKQSDNITK